MAAVQVSARIDGKIKKQAEKVFNEYGLDFPTVIRSLAAITANKRQMPFVIGTPETKPKVSLNGDEFESDTEYFKQIPGYWESLMEAYNEPIGEGVTYDPKTFWDLVKNVDN